jgi:hypothetical protein
VCASLPAAALGEIRSADPALAAELGHPGLDQLDRADAILAAVFASMVAWWNLGLRRVVFSPEAPIHARIAALERLNRDTWLLVPAQA